MCVCSWVASINALHKDTADVVFLAIGMELSPMLMPQDQLLKKSLATVADDDSGSTDSEPILLGQRTKQAPLESKQQVKSVDGASGGGSRGDGGGGGGGGRDGVDSNGGVPFTAQGRKLFLQSQWGLKEDDLVTLLDMLFQWQSLTPQVCVLRWLCVCVRCGWVM